MGLQVNLDSVDIVRGPVCLRCLEAEGVTLNMQVIANGACHSLEGVKLEEVSHL